jgi:hypothetical protein
MIRYLFAIFFVCLIIAAACGGCSRSGDDTAPWVKYQTEEFSRGISTPDSAAGIHIVIEFPKMTESSHHGVDRYINLYIDSVLHTHFGDVGKVFNYNQIIDKFFADYDNFMKDFPASDLAGWFDEDYVRVVYDTMGILALEFDYSGYTGGAHGYSQTDYANFDLHNGRPLKLSDILIAGFKKPLTQIAEAAFRRMRNIPADSSLYAAGFWFPDSVFTLNSNFSLRADKIIFFYNDYEIAPHSMGPTEIDIPYSRIEDLIDPLGRLSYLK